MKFVKRRRGAIDVKATIAFVTFGAHWVDAKIERRLPITG